MRRIDWPKVAAYGFLAVALVFLWLALIALLGAALGA